MVKVLVQDQELWRDMLQYHTFMVSFGLPKKEFALNFFSTLLKILMVLCNYNLMQWFPF